MTSPSPECMEEHSQWAALESTMAEMISPPNNRSAAHNYVATIEKGTALLQSLSIETSRLRNSSLKISNVISFSIQNERAALTEESNELTRQSSSVQALEDELSSLRRSNTEMRNKRRMAEDSIPIHQAVANEKIAEVDEIQSRHVRNLPKIKRELSLHGLMTNIKWDYNQTSVLAGEISMPGRMVHKRFVIDKEDFGEFEIAERLWDLIDG
eukprot:CAMPEP_0201680214 /NCGR_PEP_ID=MMETSP0494-20130426/50309_1 /ASSEMBLY_ACC=CAM_ASM_000839 /TAXON_ID=420259 /ORGANISM="Thalassiosira gravida, Strain GMp14c1" /LENGTH=211 /DNA_ID=CAMNT_0048163913 /DNA_START=49 /DNA_END=684 /DNA_ORIENTATION=+